MSETQCQACRDGDREAVRQACLDYVAGFLASDGERIARGVHPDLVKRTIRDGGLKTMGRETVIHLAVIRRWPATSVEVEIDGIFGDIATARITSLFVDYVHLAKLDQRWQVVNVLWLENDAASGQERA